MHDSNYGNTLLNRNFLLASEFNPHRSLSSRVIKQNDVRVVKPNCQNLIVKQNDLRLTHY